MLKDIVLEIDGKKVDAEKGQTVLEVAIGAGIEIPALLFCNA